LYVVRGEEGVAEQDPGGVEPLAASLEAFAEALRRENHTLKRTMTDPHVFSGIGNAYSDEILHRAKLSPIKWTQRVSDDEIARLHACTKTVLTEWVERLRGELKDGFPTKVTAFRPEMAVHGKYKQPCPVCGAPVQRIVRGESEINYCAPCQTGGKLLADRALSRLLRGDWPKTLEELDERKSRHRMAPAATENPAPAKKNAAKKKAPSKKAPSKKNAGPLLLFAHGAGASSASAWMRGWSKRLGRLGKVVSFDYPYMREGRKSPDKADKLIDAHAKALAFARKRHQGRVVLIGKSMGGRMGCHLSLEQQVDALVCLGYPLVSMGKSGKVRDAVLLALTTPVLFVQGTRDRLCPLDRLAKVRKKMAAPSAIHVVDSGDHSLMATKTWLKEQHTTQDAIDDAILEAVAGFLRDHGIGV
jgi:predicted alpha/beta-hydrolase family hydrolase/ribosomal protein S13